MFGVFTGARTRVIFSFQGLVRPVSSVIVPWNARIVPLAHILLWPTRPGVWTAHTILPQQLQGPQLLGTVKVMLQLCTIG